MTYFLVLLLLLCAALCVSLYLAWRRIGDLKTEVSIWRAAAEQRAENVRSLETRIQRGMLICTADLRNN